MNNSGLITDISMPEMNGLNLIKKVKKFQPDIHILIISAYSDFNYAKEAIHLGSEDYLLKPLNKVELEEALERISFSLNYISNSDTNPQDDFKIFQSNMLQRWVKGSGVLDDFSEQMEIAGIDISQKQYNVFVAHILDLDNDKMLQAFRLCSEIMTPLSGGIYFDSLTDIVGILSHSEEENRAILTKLHDQLKREFGVEVYISLGETVHHFLQVKNSYESAKFYRLASLFTGETIFSVRKEIGISALMQDSGYRNLHLLLEDKNINKAFEIASEFQKTFNPLIIKVNNNDCLVLLVIALLFLQAYDIILSSSQAEGLRLIIKRYPKPSPKEWLSDYLLYIRQYHNQQITAMHPYARKIIGIVEEDYTDSDLNISAIADRLKVTSVYLGQLFHTQTGDHFNDYLTNYRLKRACILLTTTSIKIGDIAKQVGFSSQSYLNRVFRKKYHITPLEYRQLRN